MRNLLLVCAESVVVDAATNRVSIFNLVDEAIIQQLPTVIAKLTVLYILERDDADEDRPEVSLVITQEQNELFRHTGAVGFAPGRPRTRAILAIQGLVIPAPGRIRCALFTGETQLGAHWEFMVTQAQPVVAVTPDNQNDTTQPTTQPAE